MYDHFLYHTIDIEEYEIFILQKIFLNSNGWYNLSFKNITQKIFRFPKSRKYCNAIIYYR